MKGETKQNKGINIDSKELVIALNELEKEKDLKKYYNMYCSGVFFHNKYDVYFLRGKYE